MQIACLADNPAIYIELRNNRAGKARCDKTAEKGVYRKIILCV